MKAFFRFQDQSRVLKVRVSGLGLKGVWEWGLDRLRLGSMPGVLSWTMHVGSCLDGSTVKREFPEIRGTLFWGSLK